MNLVQLLFGHVAFMLNFYAELYRENDRTALVSQPEFSTNFNLPIPTPGETFDFIVVGGGSAGCLVANRLARAHAHANADAFRVLLLEAGGDPPPQTYVPANAVQWTQFDKIMFQYDTVPQRFPHANESRMLATNVGKVLGGTSTLNYMFFNRGSPHDYDNWANLTGDESWTYANLLPHFKAFEEYAGQHTNDDTSDQHQHGFDGEMMITTQPYAPGAQRFLRAGAELGYVFDADPNGPQRLSFTQIDVNKRAGQRASSYEAFLRSQAAELPNLDIRRYSLVERVVFDEVEPGKVVRVTYTRHGFPYLAYATKEVILSAGTFGSAQILLRSGIGPAAELRTMRIEPVLDLPVGHNFQDHPLLPLAFEMLDGRDVYAPERNLTTDSMHEFLAGQNGPLSSVGGLAGQAFIASSAAEAEGFPDWSDLQLAMYSSDRGSVPGITEAVSGDLVYCWIYIGRPRSRGTVRLGPHHIENGPPLIDINMLADSVEVDMYLEGIQAALRVFENTSAYAEVGARYPNVPLAACAHLTFRSEEYWKCYVSHLVGSGMHPTGTCSMGRAGDPNAKAVVDSRLRVIGAKGLRVIDASIMPVITNANIQAAVYVIAEKGAADILAEHGVNATTEFQSTHFDFPVVSLHGCPDDPEFD